MDKIDFKIDEVVFNDCHVGFHLDVMGPITINEIRLISKKLIHRFWPQLYERKATDASLSICDSGRFDGRWYVSYALNPIGFDSLIEEFDCEKDGGVYVIKNVKL